MQVVFDMETGDPDDVLTLLLLASHPKVQLLAEAWLSLVAGRVALLELRSDVQANGRRIAHFHKMFHMVYRAISSPR